MKKYEQLESKMIITLRKNLIEQMPGIIRAKVRLVMAEWDVEYIKDAVRKPLVSWMSREET